MVIAGQRSERAARRDLTFRRDDLQRVVRNTPSTGAAPERMIIGSHGASRKRRLRVVTGIVIGIVRYPRAKRLVDLVTHLRLRGKERAGGTPQRDDRSNGSGRER